MHATYSANSAVIDLEGKYAAHKPDRFRATTSNYLRQLDERSDMPEALCLLITGLFERSVMVECSVQFRTTLTCKLSAQAPKKLLLMSGEFERFKTAFSEITGQTLDIAWKTSSKKRTRFRTGRRNGHRSNGRRGWFSDFLDGLFDWD